MKAWRFYGPGDFRLDDVPVPEIDDCSVLVKVKVVQPSVTETEIIKGPIVSYSKQAAKLLAEGKPVQRGHEYCGEVVKTGRRVTSLRAGDRVTSTGEIHCGFCRMCLSGRYPECSSPLHMGGEIPGAFAEYISLPEYALVKIPDGLTDHEVATLQPFSACVGAVYSAEIGMGDTVVVLGQGVLGLGILQLAKLSLCGPLIAVDVQSRNLELSHKYGASHVINAKHADVVKEISRLTYGEGPDIVFDAAGGSPQHGLSGFETVRQAFEMVRLGGKIIQVANLQGTMDLDIRLFRRKRIRYISPFPGTIEFLRTSAFLVANGRVEVRSQITHILHGLEKLPEAIEITENKAKYGAMNPAQIVL